jgi:putative tryptophan/tyrosine transport system substrate-binding protein
MPHSQGTASRREFVALLGGAAAWPLDARAQQPAMPLIGYLQNGSPGSPLVPAFLQGLSETGYVEGRNVAIEYRFAEGQNDRLPALVADLVRRQVRVIAVLGGFPGALAAKAASATTPIVFQGGGDPVSGGLVASLNRPGGNVTGVTSLNQQVAPKMLEALHELVPTATVIALLVNPAGPTTQAVLRDMQAAARILGVQLHVLQASTERDIDRVFAELVQVRAGGLVISNSALFGTRRDQLIALAARHAVPAISFQREYVDAGGLMSYGGSFREAFRLVGNYTGRILKGDKPADLPVQQATRIELIINMKTAKALGLTFPITLLGRADEVIE